MRGEDETVKSIHIYTPYCMKTGTVTGKRGLYVVKQEKRTARTRETNAHAALLTIGDRI